MLRCVSCWVSLALVVSFYVPASATQDAEADPNVAAIKKTADRYVEAFNRADAKSLSEMWTEKGVFVTSSGETWTGRNELNENLDRFFKETPKAVLTLRDTKIELLSPGVATESGVSSVSVGNEQLNETRYTAVHVKINDQWLIDSVRETTMPAAAPSNADKLQPLAWMVGAWSVAEGSERFEASCRWGRNQNFILQSFKIHGDNDVDFEVTQIIGWDPKLSTIRSWVFDSDGGFGVGRWSEQGGRWTVQSLYTLPDGRSGSATNIYEIVDDNSIRYKSIGRQVDGELLPSIGPVLLKRQSE